MLGCGCKREYLKRAFNGAAVAGFPFHVGKPLQGGGHAEVLDDGLTGEASASWAAPTTRRQRIPIFRNIGSYFFHLETRAPRTLNWNSRLGESSGSSRIRSPRMAMPSLVYGTPRLVWPTVTRRMRPSEG
jgi:hypothetical protein